jgi:hypothetical protein
MNKFKCKHDWDFARDFLEIRGVEKSSILQCKKCRIVLTANEAAEIELWKNTVGIQRWLSIGAFLIALASLVVAFLK